MNTRPDIYVKNNRNTGKRSVVAGLTLLSILLISLPPFMGPYGESMITQILIFSIFAMGLNIVVGYTGLFSMGHAAFFGVAGYTAGIMMVNYGIVNFWIIAPISIVLATLFAALFGIIALRVSGLYFLFVTLALGELLHSVAWKWRSMTGGADGLTGIPYPSLGFPFNMNATHFYYLVFIIFVVSVGLLYGIAKSPFGSALQGIREDEHRMQHLGYNTWMYKYLAFIIAGFFSGVSGMLFASFANAMAPEHLGVHTATLAVLMIILGSDRVFFGPMIGATIVLFLQYYASTFAPERWPLILGTVFVLSVMFLRGGISIHLIKFWNKMGSWYASTKT